MTKQVQRAEPVGAGHTENKVGRTGLTHLWCHAHPLPLAALEA